jgi:predicted O-methyltransferase YrrM
MSFAAFIRETMRAGRVRQALWARVLEQAMLAFTAEGRGRLWSRSVHAREIHQTAPYTWLERYPELFDQAARLAPDARRILSFGCSTGQELVSLRRRFPHAEIVGAEINPRSRAIARSMIAGDPLTTVLAPRRIERSFDLVFALSVLQRDPRGVAAEVEARHLAALYPFERFDAAIRSLAELLASGGLLCVDNALYRVEDSSVAGALDPVGDSPSMHRTLLGPHGRRLDGATAKTIFRKL